MKIKSVHVGDFKRFSDLTIINVPASSRLVVLAGPNGTGKSSLFDAFLTWYRQNAGWGTAHVPWYYDRPGSTAIPIPSQRVSIDFHEPLPSDHEARRMTFYFRSAYRSEPEFRLQSLSRVSPVGSNSRLSRMIEADTTVAENYQRIASQALEDVLVKERRDTTIGEYRDRIIGEIRGSMAALFPDLVFSDLGNPVADGTFVFNKGGVSGFEYLNLSGGEKAAFDLLLDVIVKRRVYNHAVYCIDEPEIHLNARVQANLLRELMRLVPDASQLWLATHSIGMMRAAKEMAQLQPGSVVFLDFGGQNFDNATVLEPVTPSRTFWESALSVALDDLSKLVAPSEVIVCEGNPVSLVRGKNVAVDATCYNLIFADEKPDTKFLSAGNSSSVVADRLAFVASISAIVGGIAVKRLIDRDDHGPSDVAQFNAQGIRVLSRRHLESFLFDDEVLTALCAVLGKQQFSADLLAAKQAALAASVGRGNLPDDVKSASGQIYNDAKRILSLTGVGNDATAFMRQTLAPLVRHDTAVYAQLRNDIFG